jgi:hypothetical protein
MFRIEYDRRAIIRFLWNNGIDTHEILHRFQAKFDEHAYALDFLSRLGMLLNLNNVNGTSWNQYRQSLTDKRNILSPCGWINFFITVNISIAIKILNLKWFLLTAFLFCFILFLLLLLLIALSTNVNVLEINILVLTRHILIHSLSVINSFSSHWKSTVLQESIFNALLRHGTLKG